MFWMCAGLTLFLLPHSVSIFARTWRDKQKIAIGPKVYDGLYSLLSLVGLILIVWGYGQTRVEAVHVWNPPPAMRHVAAVLMLISFVLLAAAYIPRNKIKAVIGHPMAVAIKVWAFAHLLSNGRLGDMVLFGVFLVWSIVYYASSRRHDRLTKNTSTVPANMIMTLYTVVAGVLFWVVTILYLHLRLIGVQPFS